MYKYDLILDVENTTKLKKLGKLVCEDKVLSPELAVAIVKNVYKADKMADEYVYMVCCDTKGAVIGSFVLSHGSINASIVSIRGIFLRALLCGAARIVILHNHPSQDYTPSKEDMNVYSKIKDASCLMEIPLMDFIIVVRDNYYSFMEHNI